MKTVENEASGIRTPDNLIKSQVLYQLSYTPIFDFKCPVPESNQRHEDFQSSALPTELTGHWVAGVGFEPTTFGLWARRASRLLHPAILVSAFIQLSKMWRKIQTVLFSQNYFLILTPNGRRKIRTVLVSQSRFLILTPNGRRRIRTFEGIASRFTVCPLWPLGNPPITLFTKIQFLCLM